jgi:hypothetical protein
MPDGKILPSSCRCYDIHHSEAPPITYLRTIMILSDEGLAEKKRQNYVWEGPVKSILIHKKIFSSSLSRVSFHLAGACVSPLMLFTAYVDVRF